MPNVFLEGLQRPAILQNNSGLPDYSEANDGDVLQIESGEPTWGAVDALPEIEETDEGKVLAVDQGEAVWADAPSGLPEITNSDEGKVLTVGREVNVIQFIPEQSITTALSEMGAYMAPLSNVSKPVTDFSNGDEIEVVLSDNVTQDGDYTLTFGVSDGVSGFFSQTAPCAVFNINNTWNIAIFEQEPVTVTVAATAEEVSDELSPLWKPNTLFIDAFHTSNLIPGATYELDSLSMTPDQILSAVNDGYNCIVRLSKKSDSGTAMLYLSDYDEYLAQFTNIPVMSVETVQDSVVLSIFTTVLTVESSGAALVVDEFIVPTST